MLKLAILPVAALLASSAAKAEYNQGFSYPIGLEETGDNWLALRSQPTTRSGVRLRKLGPDTLFNVTHRQGAWYAIRLLDGETGWVYSKFVGCCAPGPSKPAAAPLTATNVIVPVLQSSNNEAAQLRGKVEELTALVRAGQERNERDAAATRPAPIVVAAPDNKTGAEPLKDYAPRAETGISQQVIPYENRPKTRSFDATAADEEALAQMTERFEQAAINRTPYSTPIRPDDQDLGITSRAASEQFPRVPFYIPGTRESGRFWVEPRVSDTGKLFYDMVFVDPRANVDQKRAVIDLTPEQIERMKIGISKLSDWSIIAHKNELRRSYRKRVDCFPESSCPREGEKVEEKSSTEIVFIVSDDGSTAGRIQRNKGRYDEGYNISIKSAKLLASYLHYVQSRAEKEYVAGTRTNADIDAMFK